MRRHVRRVELCVSLLLALLLALPGCGTATGVYPADAAARVAPASSDKAAVQKYMKASLKDLDIIDTLIRDDDLGLTDDAEESNDKQLSDEDIAKYTDLLGGYSKDVKKAIDTIGSRETPGNADITSFKAAELAEFQLTADLLEEYIQVLGYYTLMTDVSESLGKLGNNDSTDLESIYKSYNESITKAIDVLKTGTIPTCLKSMNDHLIEALGETNDAVLYLLNSIALNDPLRQSAAVYRSGILLRKLGTISTGVEKDLMDRQKKLTADAKSIQKTNDGLKQWLKSNLDKLD